MAKILLVEDDPAIAERLKEWLAAEGHLLEWASSGEDGLQLLEGFGFDVVLLDWVLPGITGLEVCKQFRRMGGLSKVIFLTGQGDIDEKEQGLNFGADDYVVKPFECRELSARIRSVLRRPAVPPTPSVLIAGAVSLNPVTRMVKSGERVAHLMPKESALFEHFMKNPGKSYSIADLTRAVWPGDGEMSAGTVRSWLRNLRAKLASVGEEGFIKTEPGYLYKIDGGD